MITKNNINEIMPILIEMDKIDTSLAIMQNDIKNYKYTIEAILNGKRDIRKVKTSIFIDSMESELAQIMNIASNL